ncbi:MFS transporter [Solihabitans fulvus]|uniref:MFS transporter n=1 Tax=Solihabitans fulvus TaxID=1892852 RepID=UPI001CB75F4A|nr:MFS transporter [Solihabitans fulvus]
MTPSTVDGTRVVRLYNAFQLCTGLLWWLPIFYVYQRDAGLSDEQIFRIQGIYYLAFCLLDIPTGALADRFDYPRFLLGGGALLLLANLIPVWWPSYGGFLTHFLLIALAYSLVSGAGSAYLYESLRRSGRVEAYQRAEGSARAYTLVGRVVCLPVAGLLMQWHRPAPYLLSAACCAIGVLVALRLPALPADPDARTGGTPPLSAALAGAWRQLRASPTLVLLMVQGVGIFTLVRICQANLYQPILAAKHLPLAGYGVLMAATTLVEVAGAARSSLARRIGDLRAVLALTVVMAASLALVVPAGLAGTVLALCVFAFASGMAFPVQRTLVNSAISHAAHRATLLSVESLVDRLVCALVVLLLGDYLARGAMNAFLVHLAVVTAAAMAVLAVLLRLARRRRATVLEEIAR